MRFFPCTRKQTSRLKNSLKTPSLKQKILPRDFLLFMAYPGVKQKAEEIYPHTKDSDGGNLHFFTLFKPKNDFGVGVKRLI